MADRYIGLDIGTFAVRAAEVSGEPGNLTLHRFAQITLPPRAVVDGEIVDPPAVTNAIRSLWDSGGFKSKKVVIGIGNRWVKVREAEVPALSHEDVRSSLRYEAQEVIPFADEDAIVDFVVQDRVPGPEGGEMLKILVIAAQRQMVSAMIDTVNRAGLSVSHVDLTPFALVRALGPAPEPGVSEAIVSIGAGLTNVIVHTGGVPRLVRMTPRAGGAVTENLTRALGVDTERAEALKRGAGVALADPQTAQAADIIANELGPLVQEIQGSLDYFLAQTDDVELRRVLLTGAGAKMAGLRARLATELRVPVEMASPLEYMKLGKTGLSDDQLTAAAAAMAAPVGLALAPMASPATKLTTLFPADVAKAGAARRGKVLTGVAVGVFAGLLAVGWVVRIGQVQLQQNRAEDVEAEAARLQIEVNRLAPFGVMADTLAANRAQTQVVLASDVDMPAMLDRMTAVLPSDVGLTSVTMSITGASTQGVPAGATASPTMGTITLSGTALNHDGPAHWITEMRTLNILNGVWVPSQSLSGADGRVTWSGKAVFTNFAKSDRSEQYPYKPGDPQ